MNRECRCGKIQYDDKKAAVTFLNWIKEKGHRKHNSDTVPTRAYPCPDSAVWHVTSDKERGGAKYHEPLKHTGIWEQLIKQNDDEREDN